MTPKQRREQDALTKKLTHEGKIIEFGFNAMLLAGIPPGSPAEQLRYAYMGGAQHLFASIMVMLDPGEEATEADLRRMDLISAELNAWANEQRQRRGPER